MHLWLNVVGDREVSDNGRPMRRGGTGSQGEGTITGNLGNEAHQQLEFMENEGSSAPGDQDFLNLSSPLLSPQSDAGLSTDVINNNAGNIFF